MYGYVMGASIWEQQENIAGGIYTLLLLLGGAALLDLLLGDPRRMHPIIGIGKLISAIESRWNQGTNRQKFYKGLIMAVFVPGITFALSWLVVIACYQLSSWIGFLAEIVLIYLTIAMRGLADAAEQVRKPLLSSHLPLAREALARIVGRDTQDLSEQQIVRGTVETVAENTTDGVIAPLFWAAIGGAPAAMAYRAVNTLDSMVGYKRERYLYFGRASARLDDIANWFPARLTALCMWLSGWFISLLTLGQKQLYHTAAWSIVLRDAPKHPSPNSGWPEGMTAALLGIQLGGVNTYQGVVSQRALIGEARHERTISHIQMSVWLMHGAWLVFLAFTSVVISLLYLFRLL